MNALLPTSLAYTIAGDDPARIRWAGTLLALVIVGILALYVGWLLARGLRLRHQRMLARTGTKTELGDAWSEAALRMGPGEGDDPDLPPESGPPTGPHAQWQS